MPLTVSARLTWILHIEEQLARVVISLLEVVVSIWAWDPLLIADLTARVFDADIRFTRYVVDVAVSAKLPWFFCVLRLTRFRVPDRCYAIDGAWDTTPRAKVALRIGLP
jgi:hypothetical protein